VTTLRLLAFSVHCRLVSSNACTSLVRQNSHPRDDEARQMICLLARPLRRVCGSEFVISLSIASETFLFFFCSCACLRLCMSIFYLHFVRVPVWVWAGVNG